MSSIVSLSQGKVNVKKQFTELDYEKKESANGEIVEFNGNLFSISTIGRGKKAQIILSKHDMFMKKLKSANLSEDGVFNSVEKMMIIEDKLMLVGKLSESKSSHTYFLKEVDASSLKAIGAEKFLSKSTAKVPTVDVLTFLYENGRLLMVKDLFDNKKLGTADIAITMFDKNIEKQWSVNYQYDAKNLISRNENFVMNSSGDVFYSHTKYDRKANVYYSILKGITENGKEEIEKELLFEDEAYFENYTIGMSNNELVVAGFLKYFPKGQRIQKFFVQRYKESSLTIKSQSIEEIPFTETLKYLTTKIAAKTKEKQSKGKAIIVDEDLLFTEIIARDNGEIILVAESQKKSTNVYKDNNDRTITEYNLEAGNIYAISISGDSKLNWATKIPKRFAGQISKMHYLGRSGLKVTNFIVMEGKDGLYFVFNDHIDNHAKDNDGTNMLKPKFTKKRVVSVYKIDSEGNMTREILATSNEIKMSMDGSKSGQVSGGKAVLFFGEVNQEKKALVLDF